MTTNEQIIIDGKVKNCKILFECNSVDDLASFIMMRAGVEITPDNAPVFDNFDIRLIAEPRSPYGFSSLFKRNENIDEWEYMGFGHSGACSVVTALLKQLQRKTAECEELKKKFSKFFNIDNQECWDIAFLKDENARYKQALDEIEEIVACKEIDIETNNALWLQKYILARSCEILDIIRKAKGANVENT